MSDCDKMVVDVYNHPDVLNLISKIKPASIQDDLHQEIAVSLLEQPCDKIATLFAGNNLVRYTIKVCWNMAIGSRNYFAKTYRKLELLKAVEYLRLTQPLPELPISLAIKAKDVLQRKNATIYDDHEVRIFNKYVELGSGRAVARYYNIPVNHVCDIINKVRTELKETILK